MEPFIWPLRVYYEDTDSAGVVYYANYLKFMERARTEWLRTLGYEQETLRHKQGLAFMVRSARLDYDRPARLDQALEVHSQLHKIRRVGLTFTQDIMMAAPTLVCCRGLIEVTCVDATTLKPKAIPKPLLMELQRAS